MSHPLSDFLAAVQVADPQEAAGLQVFGLRRPSDTALAYTTLDDALAAGTVEVNEVNESGSVPTLRVSNRADTLVFLMAGEQLVGAKQNRVLNASLMVDAHTDLPIPVSCVEAGRWGYRSRHFSSSGTSSHSHLRHKMAKQVTASYRSSGRPASDQGEVWQEVARKLDKMGSSSPSSALHQAYQDHMSRLGDVVGRLPAPEGCCGAAFAVRGRLAGVDLFDRPETLTRLWPKLVRAYAIDALEEPESTEAPLTPEAVRQWLLSATAAKAEPFKSPGLGDDVRLEGPNLVGAGLVVREQPVHVELFAEDSPQ
jgi:hypothetical protein